jgi:hypothetical protein
VVLEAPNSAPLYRAAFIPPNCIPIAPEGIVVLINCLGPFAQPNLGIPHTDHAHGDAAHPSPFRHPGGMA